jgi:hypothetical protein
VFTAALVWVGWQQWRTLREHEAWMQKHDAHLEKLADAAKKNAEVSESAFKLGQRADVLLEGATFSHGQVLSEKDTRVVLQFRNFGRTRADSSRLSLNLLIDGVPPTDNTLVPSVVIGAGDTQKISSARFVEFLTQTTAQGVLSGKTILRFESEIAYKDIFGDSHRSYYEGTLDVGAGVFKIDKQEAD